jgi:hypothetical protein
VALNPQNLNPKPQANKCPQIDSSVNRKRLMSKEDCQHPYSLIILVAYLYIRCVAQQDHLVAKARQCRTEKHQINTKDLWDEKVEVVFSLIYLNTGVIMLSALLDTACTGSNYKGLIAYHGTKEQCQELPYRVLLHSSTA